MSRAQDALLRLYENADLRDELTDDEAEALLKWAEAELARIDAASPDDAGFEAQAETLTSLLKRMNRFAGRQGQISAQGVDPAPTNIAGLATELGHPASPDQIAATGTGDPASTIAALTAFMSVSAQAAPPETESPVSAQAASDAPPSAPETDLPIQAQTTEPAPQENLQPSQPAAPTLPAEPASEPFGDPFDDIDL